MNYAVQYNALQRRYESLLADMQQVLGLLRRNRHRAALALLDSVLGGESGDEDESDRDESQAEAQTEADAEAPAPIVRPTVAFVGRSFRLGASEPVGDAPVGDAAVGDAAVGDAADGVLDGAAGDAADEASDSDELMKQPAVVAATARTCTCSLAAACGGTLSLQPSARTALTV